MLADRSWSPGGPASVVAGMGGTTHPVSTTGRINTRKSSLRMGNLCQCWGRSRTQDTQGQSDLQYTGICTGLQGITMAALFLLRTLDEMRLSARTRRWLQELEWRFPDVLERGAPQQPDESKPWSFVGPPISGEDLWKGALMAMHSPAPVGCPVYYEITGPNPPRRGHRGY